MAAFYSNQVQLLYVATAVADEALTTSSAEGNVYLNDKSEVNGTIQIQHVGKGGLTTSDTIETRNIEYIDVTSSTKLASKLQKTVITLPTEYILGEDYILRINICPFISLSESNSYLKDVVVHCTSANNTAATFGPALVALLKKNFKRDIAVKDCFGFNSTSTTVEIYGVPQTDWKLGKTPVSDVHFTVVAGEIWDDGEEIQWADDTAIVTSEVAVGGTYYDIDGTSHTLTSNSGKKVADLEYFTLKERADIYGNMGYPYDMPSETMVAPSTEYAVLNVHYSFIDGGTAFYKSEKDLTIVMPNASISDLKDLGKAIAASNEVAKYREDGVVTAID